MLEKMWGRRSISGTSLLLLLFISLRLPFVSALCLSTVCLLPKRTNWNLYGFNSTPIVFLVLLCSNIIKKNLTKRVIMTPQGQFRGRKLRKRKTIVSVQLLRELLDHPLGVGRDEEFRKKQSDFEMAL